MSGIWMHTDKMLISPELARRLFGPRIAIQFLQQVQSLPGMGVYTTRLC
jgi:hypothetical protein